MNGIINFAYLLFIWNINSSIKASILIILILLIRVVFKYKINIKFKYTIWFLIVFRLLVPNSFESRASINNYIPTVEYNSLANRNNNNVNLAPNDIREDENDKAATMNLDQEYEIRYNNKPILFNLPIILFFLWLAGMFLSFSSVIVQNYKFNNLIRKESIISEQKIINLFEECKAKMYITKLIPLIATKMVNVPTLYGVITPRILLPQNILKTLTMDDLRFIFLHELSHFKRKDIWVYLILTILTSLHWFNPLIRYAFHKMREDCMLILLKHTTMVKVL